MKRKTILVAAAMAGMLGGNLAMVNIAQAFDMGNMMSPGKWFGDNDDDRYYRRYGGYGPYGGGYGPYGGGYGPYGGGYGPYGGGYGPYGGGYGPYGGYGGRPSTIVVNPPPASGSSAPRAPR